MWMLGRLEWWISVVCDCGEDGRMNVFVEKGGFSGMESGEVWLWMYIYNLIKNIITKLMKNWGIKE